MREEPGGARIGHPDLARKTMPADDAAALILGGSSVGVSGVTGAGYPKAVPPALARRIADAHARGEPFEVRVWTGASTAPELEGVLAATDGVDLRMPYQSDPVARSKINAGQLDYADLHLSQAAQAVREGTRGHLDLAIVEIAGVTPDGELVPSSSVGIGSTWLDLADRVILEVNAWQPAELEGMHDIVGGTTLPPGRTPVPIVHPGDRIGVPYLRCPSDKIVAVVPTHAPDRGSASAPPGPETTAIAGHVIEFLRHEVARGRLPRALLPLQVGIGNVAHGVLAGLRTWPDGPLQAYTGVIQDPMLDLLLSGTLGVASATAVSLSPAGAATFASHAAGLAGRVVLRPQEISHHPEVVRRLGVLAVNGMLEADIYGNVNSSHVMGSSVVNGIGGSADFARNAAISFFLSPSVAKGGAISAIVPMVSHVDHTEHDVGVIVTEQGLADLRGLAPRRRARQVIDRCAHPAFRDALDDYVERAQHGSPGLHTPHLLDEALSWHARFVRTGTMRTGTAAPGDGHVGRVADGRVADGRVGGGHDGGGRTEEGAQPSIVSRPSTARRHSS